MSKLLDDVVGGADYQVWDVEPFAVGDMLRMEIQDELLAESIARFRKEIHYCSRCNLPTMICAKSARTRLVMGLLYVLSNR